jgi:hypothetical protein
VRDLARACARSDIADRAQSLANGEFVSSHPETLGALRRSPFGAPERALRSVKDEMRQNLLDRL